MINRCVYCSNIYYEEFNQQTNHDQS